MAVRKQLLTVFTAATLTGLTGVAAPMATAPAQAAPALTSATKVKYHSGARVRQMRERVVRIALKQRGDHYVTGATGPNTFDCSGLVVYSYRMATGITLPRTSYSMESSLRHVRKRNRAPGDVVFFRGGGHVAIYIGRNRFVHATNPSIPVHINSMNDPWYRNAIAGYGRVIQVR